MWKIIVENYRIFLATAAIILTVVSLIFNCLGWKRLRKAHLTDKELVSEREKALAQAEKAMSYGEIFLVIPKLIKEAEEIFRSPASGALKFGYVIQQVKGLFEKAHISADPLELTDYIESILATPEKKGEQ